MKNAIVELKSNEVANVHGGLWICRDQMIAFIIGVGTGWLLTNVSEITSNRIVNNIVGMGEDLALYIVIAIGGLTIAKYHNGKVNFE